jgi:GT2 family glycosyltransferase
VTAADHGKITASMAASLLTRMGFWARSARDQALYHLGFEMRDLRSLTLGLRGRVHAALRDTRGLHDWLCPGVPRSRDPRYQEWLCRNSPSERKLKALRGEMPGLRSTPRISVIVPVYETPEPFLRAMIDSVRAQVYPNWQLCLVDDGSKRPHVKSVLVEAARADPRIEVLSLETNQGMVAASNAAAAMAKGEFLALLDHDDLLTVDALFEVARALNEHADVDMIYSDEDKVDETGLLSGPFFKPDFCPDSFLSRMYPCHLTVLRRALFEELKGFRAEYEGGHVYDLTLRLTERTSLDRVRHIPRILYHWRMHAGSTARDAAQKPYVYDADRRAIQAAVDRRGEPGRVTASPGPAGCWSIRYEITRPGKVSIIIPTRDQPEILEACVASIFERSAAFSDFEVIVVDNGSVEPKTLLLFDAWRTREPDRFQTIRVDVPFNFSLLCNRGVQASNGDYLLFLNNDTKVITDDWLPAMIEQAQRPSIGAVGALLLYEDGTVQHAGAILGLGGVAAHSHRGAPGESPGYAGQLVSINNYLSVAGACLMCRRGLFEELKGFDEVLPGDYEDVDLCLRMFERGLWNVCLPHVRLYHFESKSRGKDYRHKDPEQRRHTVDYIVSKWRKYIDHDPCYNPNLTRAHEDYRINLDDQEPQDLAAFDSRADRKRPFLCVVDEASAHGGALVVRGWAMGRSGERLRRAHVLGGGVAADALVGLPRPDVHQSYPELGNEAAGFHLHTPLPASASRRLRVTLELSAEGLSERIDLKVRA